MPYDRQEAEQLIKHIETDGGVNVASADVSKVENLMKAVIMLKNCMADLQTSESLLEKHSSIRGTTLVPSRQCVCCRNVLGLANSDGHAESCEVNNFLTRPGRD